jgi:chromosome segregation ATPase
MKKVVLMLASVCAIGLLTGCGVPQEEHDAMIADLEAKHTAEVEALNIKVSDLESIVDSEKAKVRKTRIELDDATERISGLQQKSAETAKALATEKAKAAKLEGEIKTAKSMTTAAQEEAAQAVENYNTLDVEYQALKVRFENFQNNFGSSSTASAPAASSAPAAAPAEEKKPESAKSLLDEMSGF